MQDKYQEFRNWYFKNHDNQQLLYFKNQYYYHLERYQILAPFPEWYYEFVTVMEIVPEQQINVLTNIQKTWTTVNGQTIMSIHPPPQSLELTPNGDTTLQPLMTTAYVEIPSKASQRDIIQVKDIVPIMKQNNYTNLYFQTVGKQLTRIEESIENFKDRQLVPTESTIQPVNVKPPLEVTNFKLRSDKQDNEFMETLLKKMSNLNVGRVLPPEGSSSIHMISIP
ncbi:hypothetical protein ACSBR1_005070 [Camellia fascicularis]